MHFNSIVFVCLLTHSISFAQVDSSKSVAMPVNAKHISIKGVLFINGGIGQSTILYALYYSAPQGKNFGISQSIVPDLNIDYGIGRIWCLGAGVAYQTAKGYAILGSSPFWDPRILENFSRLNISGRFLINLLSTNRVQLYTGLRVGVSYWTDIASPPPQGFGGPVPLIEGNNVSHLSIQIPIGVKIFWGIIGIHVEAAIGTPYYAEGGITFRIGKKR